MADADSLTMQTLNNRAEFQGNFNTALGEITSIGNLPPEFRSEITQVFPQENNVQEITETIVEKPEEREEPITIDYILTSAILCQLAKSDARHDFGTNMVDTAITYIPNGNRCGNALPEDTFMHAHIYGKDILTKNYEHINVLPEANLDDVFTARGIRDVYLVVDTYSSGLRNQLLKAKNIINPPVKYYWVENRQTQYDPADKTYPTTSAGKVLFTNNNKLIYVRENIKTNGILYPPWKLDIPINGNYTMPDSFNINNFVNKNKLFYCNNTIFQIAEETTNGSINTKCIMKMEDGSYVVMDKEMSKISKGLFSSITYAALHNKLRDHILHFIDPANNVPPADFTDAHHTVAKRLGDQGQALSALIEKMLLKTLNGTGLESSGNHAFVSIDRLAIGASLEYRVPIVVYCRYDGSLDVYIRKDKIGNDGYIKALQAEKKNTLINTYRSAHAQIASPVETIRTNITTYNNDINRLKNALSSAIQAAIGNTNESYKTYIKNIFSALTSINMKPSINALPADFTIRAPDNLSDLSLNEIEKEFAKLEQIQTIQKQLAVLNVDYDITKDRLNNKKINEIRLFTPIRVSRALETLGDTICGGSYLSFIVDELIKKNYTELYGPFNQKFESIFEEIIRQYGEQQGNQQVHTEISTYLTSYIETILDKLPTENKSIVALMREEERHDEASEEYPEFIITHMPLANFINSAAIFKNDSTINNRVQAPVQAPVQEQLGIRNLYGPNLEGGGMQTQKGGYNEIQSIYNLKDIQKIFTIIILFAFQHNIKIEGVPILGDPQPVANQAAPRPTITISEDFIKSQLNTYLRTNVIDYEDPQPIVTPEANTPYQTIYVSAVEYEIYKHPELKALYTTILNLIESKRYMKNGANSTRIILNKRLSYILYLLNIEITDEHIRKLDTTLEKYTIPLFFQSIVHDIIYKNGNGEIRAQPLSEEQSLPLTVNNALEKNIYSKILNKSNMFRKLFKYYNVLNIINYVNNIKTYKKKYNTYRATINETATPVELANTAKSSQTELANEKETVIKEILKTDENVAPIKTALNLPADLGICELVKNLKPKTPEQLETAINSTPLPDAQKNIYKQQIKKYHWLPILKNIFEQMQATIFNTEVRNTLEIPNNIIAPAAPAPPAIAVGVAGGSRMRSKCKSKYKKTKYRKTTRRRLRLITRRKNRK